AELVRLRRALLGVELFLRDGTDVAEHVRRRATERVGPHGRLLHGDDVVEVVVVLGEVELERLRDVVDDRHGHVGGEALVVEAVLDGSAVVGLVHVARQLGAEPVEDAVAHDGFQRCELLLVDGDDDGDAVVDEDDAVAVEDAAARRLLQQRARLDGLRRVLELRRGHHLQVPEAGEQRREQRDDDDAEDPEAEGGVVAVHDSTSRPAPWGGGIDHRTTRNIGCTSAPFTIATTNAIVTRWTSRNPSMPTIFASNASTTTPIPLPATAVTTGIHHAARSTVACVMPTR